MLGQGDAKAIAPYGLTRALSAGEIRMLEMLPAEYAGDVRFLPAVSAQDQERGVVTEIISEADEPYAMPHTTRPLPNTTLAGPQ